MKKLIIPICTIFIFISCGDNGEKKATIKLQQAQEALSNNNFDEAKQHIDSIKILYPKAFQARREGISLLQQVELKEQERNLLYLDSILKEKNEEFERIKSRFVLEKDEEYQKVGNYFWPTQTVEKNLHRSFLRFQVDEMGNMRMTSIYQGQSPIHHYAIKVTAPDGTFAETPRSNDSYETGNMGEKIEQADYPLGKDGDVIKFIYLNKDQNLKVEYIGERKYSITMSATDRKALSEIYELTLLLSSIETAKKEHEEAKMKIEFVKRNMQNSRTQSNEN